MKQLIFLLLNVFFLIKTSSSQSVFTYTMVYDYDVNDTFVYSGNGGQYTILKVITSKNYSANGNTVTYGTSTYQSSWSTGPFGPQQTNVSANPTEVYSYLNYTLVASNYFPNNMYGIFDSTRNDNKQCGRSTYYAASFVRSHSTFSTHDWTYKYTLGLGMTYFEEDNSSEELVYYHKVGGAPCGNRSSLVALSLVQNTADQISLEIYPNPLTDILHVKSSLPVKQLSVMDLAGRNIVLPVEGNRADLTVVQPGIYFITAVNNTPMTVKKIIKTD